MPHCPCSLQWEAHYVCLPAGVLCSSTCKVGASSQAALHASHSGVKALVANDSHDVLAATMEQELLIDVC